MLLRLAWAALTRHRSRTLLAVLGVAVSAAMLLDMVMLSSGMRASFRNMLLAKGFQLRLAPKGTLPFDTDATIPDATNVIRTLPNINMVCPKPERPRYGECWAASGRVGAKNAFLGGSCPLDLYINGVISPDNDLEKLAVSEFAGVELYLGGASIPALYNKTGSSCGVLLLWLRDR